MDQIWEFYKECFALGTSWLEGRDAELLKFNPKATGGTRKVWGSDAELTDMMIRGRI